MKKSKITVLLLVVFTAIFSQSDQQTEFQKRLEVIQINFLKDLGMSTDQILLISQSGDFQQILAEDIILYRLNTEKGRFALLKFSQEFEKAKELKTSVDFDLEKQKQKQLANKEKQEIETKRNEKRIYEMIRVLSEEEADRKYGILNISVPENVNKVRINNYETDYKFSEGLLAVKNKDIGKWGFIDEDGNVSINFIWDKVSNFENGIATVAKIKNVTKFKY